jgi:hypothetical protein
MMDGLPKSVRVGPHVIAIKVLPEKEMADDFGALEMCKLEMRLCDRYAGGSLAVDTAIHEVLHAIWHVSLKESGIEEQMVSAIASQLTQVIRDNPEFMKWILATVKK